MSNGFDGVRFDASSALTAAAQLDALADRIAAGMDAEQVKLDIAPAGADEVSVAAAQTLNAVAAQFATVGADSVTEVRQLAAALRAQVVSFGQAEDDNALGFGVTAV
ncbi:PE family protein [Nocardia sp. 2]|uniref:PE family protein n=1 Tax=Nocardia acididurans TaxID=2802282 RepID=A0ABS1M3E6_9NOCA|nr:PE family protein [Nocardia acididurans]MBL1075177.1 PE family protein [Nocardia acididurans]